MMPHVQMKLNPGLA